MLEHKIARHADDNLFCLIFFQLLLLVFVGSAPFFTYCFCWCCPLLFCSVLFCFVLFCSWLVSLPTNVISALMSTRLNLMIVWALNWQSGTVAACQRGRELDCGKNEGSGVGQGCLN